MIRPGEPLAALRTDETLLTSVGSQMALQLVRSSEGLAAENPATGEGPLTCVPPQVSLQVARLAVHLAAAGHVAHMLTSAHLPVPFHSVGRAVLAVWTLAAPATPGCHALRVLEQGRCNLGRVACSCRWWARWGVGGGALGGRGRMRPHTRILGHRWWVACWVLGRCGSVGWPPGSRILWVLGDSHHGRGGRGREALVGSLGGGGVEGGGSG